MNIKPEILPWNEIKERISDSFTHPTGHRLLEMVQTDLPKLFSVGKLQYMLDNFRPTYNPDLDQQCKLKLMGLLDFAKQYTMREPWYGLLSVKVVLPSRCQAKCAFCYNSHADYGNQCIKTGFTHYSKIANSIKAIHKHAAGRPISIEITGGEPTFDLETLSNLLETFYKEGIPQLAKRITLTSNGYQLKDILTRHPLSGYFFSVVNYLNLSLHSTFYDERCSIFGTDKIPTNEDVVQIADGFYKKGVPVSGVFVVDDFDLDVNEFDRVNKWSYDCGLVSTRWRSNVFTPNANGVHQFAEKLADTKVYSPIVLERAADSTYAILNRGGSNLTYLLEGVEDPSITSYGLSMVVRADGAIFHDAACHKRFNDDVDSCRYIPLKYVFDIRDTAWETCLDNVRRAAVQK